ncbi:uncharacterized protein LOC142160762 [Mixophyes fleayi]|uniref:uncharacterized protein LOC142160762 n=1 Tax=Mixophyes fleayi TaxID=3061075 RepID=UPI003F4DDC2C
MESVSKDGKVSEGEAVSLQQTLTSTCQGTEESDSLNHNYETLMELKADLQQGNLEVLTSGTSLPPCNKAIAGHGSHDASPSNDNTDRLQNVPLTSNLEAVGVLVETQDRYTDTDQRHLSNEERAMGLPETSSDEWETASEDSVAFGENVGTDDIKIENSNGQRQCDTKDYSNSQEDTVGILHKEISNDHFDSKEIVSEETGPQGPETVSEETGPQGPETVSEETGPQGPETVSEETGPQGPETVSEETGPQGPETIREETGPQGPETVGEETGPQGPETVGEETGPQGPETVGEETGPQGPETVGEETGPQGPETVGEETGPQGPETVGEETGPQGPETVGEETGPQGPETVGEETGPQGPETVGEETGPQGPETVGEETGPQGPETVGEETGPQGPETVGEETGPQGPETVGEETGPQGPETVGEETGPQGPETVGEETGPQGAGTVGEETGLLGAETVCELFEGDYRESLNKENDNPAVSDKVDTDLKVNINEEKVDDTKETFREEVDNKETITGDDHKVTVCEGTQAEHGEAVTEGTQVEHGEAVTEGTQAEHREVVTEETQAEHREAVTEGTQAEDGEAVTEETQAEHGEAVTEETQAEHGEAVTEGTQAEHGENVTEGTQAEHGEAVTEGTQAEHGEAVTEGTQAEHGEAVTEGTQAEHGEAVTEGTQAEHGEAVTEETQAEHGEAVTEGTHAEHGEAVTEGTQAEHGEAVTEGTQAEQGEAVTEGTEAEHGEAVTEGTQAEHGEAATEGTQAERGEAVTEETQAERGEAVTAGTHAERGEAVTEGTQAEQGEAVTEGTQAEHGEAVTEGTQAEHGEAVTEGTQAEHGEAVTEGTQAEHGEAVTEGTQAEHGEAVTEGTQAEHGEAVTEGPQAEQGEAVTEGTQAEQGEAVTEGTQAEQGEAVTEGTQAEHGEAVTEGTQAEHGEAVTEGTQAEHREAVTEETQAEHGEAVTEETQAEHGEAVTEEDQADYKETVAENTVQDIYKPGSKETSEGKKEIENEDINFIESVIIEPSSEDGDIVNKSSKETSNEERVFEYPNELFSENSQISNENKSDTVKESATTKSENDNLDRRWDVKETSETPIGTIETTYLESKRQEEPGVTEVWGETKLETGEGLSEDLPEMNSHDPTLKEEPSYIDRVTSKGSQVDVSGQLRLELIFKKEENKEGQTDREQYIDDIDTHANSTVLFKSEYVTSKDSPSESSDNLDKDHNDEERKKNNVHVALACGQGPNEFCLQQTDMTWKEENTSLKETSSFQKEMTADQEPLQIDIRGVDVGVPPSGLDEPDYCILKPFSDTTFKDSHFEYERVVKLISLETAQSLSRENPYTVLGDRKLEQPVMDSDQDIMVYDSEIGKETEENFGMNNPDLVLSYDREEMANVPQADPYIEGSPGGTDSITSSLITTAPQTRIPNESVEPQKDSILYPKSDENISNTYYAQEKKEYTFNPTQIFNPILLQLGTPEEPGFYQENTFEQNTGEKTYPCRLRSPPRDNQVLLRGQQPDHIVGKNDGSLTSSDETSDTKPSLNTPVGPLWLPPRPVRHIVDSGGAKHYRPLQPSENQLVRRPTIRHKRNSQVVDQRFPTTNLPRIPQEYYSEEPSGNLQRSPQLSRNRVQMSAKNRQLARQEIIYEDKEKIGELKKVTSMDRLAEEEESPEKDTLPRHTESVVLRVKRGQVQPPPSALNIHRRYSTLIHSSSLLYQEYSDVALNQEIQRQKPGNSPAEEKDPGSPRLRRRILSSQDSYLQRLSVSSADSLWQDLPKIRDSSTFLTMTREEQKLQEAKFELIMSEALYLRSLNIAVDHFQRSTELHDVVGAQDRQWLFSRLSEVRDASSDFLFDLEEEFESNMYNFQVCDVVIAHEPHFRRVYLPYVTNQSYQDRTFQRLMSGNPRFQQVLAKLENDPVCQRLSLKSFLILPFQRITRLRLLLQNILKRSAPGSNEELQATDGHNALEKLIRDCNESVQRMKDTEELILLNQKIQFECKIFPLISQSRRLVKHGEVTSLEFNSPSFKWKVTTRPVYLHLFNDCLLLSRVREGGRFVVFDHASEFRVERCQVKLHTNQKNVFRVFLRDSAALGREVPQDIRETEYIFRTETQSQKLRWICALSSPREEIDFLADQVLPQMQCLKSYKSRENDELSLEKADILLVTQNSDDGWLRGVRLSDQHSGWFPQSHVQPISRNACIRNLQEEKRLQSARAKLQPK